LQVEALLERLEQVTRTGSGWGARCPAHHDLSPSLSVAVDDEKILLYDHAGCTLEAICAALQIAPADLWFRRRSNGHHERRNYGAPAAYYDYVDAAGAFKFQTLRFDDPKDFRQRHLDPETGEWIWNMADVERVLYRLPEVIAAVAAGAVVYVVEGEKDVETLRAAGYTATCNPMGAGKWRAEYAEVLKGARVVVVADRDEPGRNHANHIRQTLVGKATELWLVQAKVGKDTSDHFAAGYGVRDFVERKQRSRKGIVTAVEMARAGLEDLNASEHDLPGYAFNPVLPITFRPGRVYAIGAYTGDGKTRFGLQGFRTLASLGVHMGYFSLEMVERDLRNILLAHAGVPLEFTENPWRIREDANARLAYERALAEIGSWTAEIVVESSMNAKKITDYTRDREYDAIVVDHLHRFPYDERSGLEGQVRELTNLALDSNICVVLLCQLRENRGNGNAFPRPTLAHFKDTSVIEQEASMCLSLWRQRVDGVEFSTVSKIQILKNRHTTGPADRAGQSWTSDYSTELQLFQPSRLTPAVVAA
jgi:hypothetical protein